MDPDRVRVDLPRRPGRAVVAVGHDVVLRRLLSRVVPDEDPAVAFAHVPRAGRDSRWSVEPRDLDDLPVTVEPPAMERADDPVIADRAADSEVGAEVWAVRVEDPDPT